MFLKQLGRRLRERRELRRLTQGDIASALQINPQAVSKWERGDNAPDIVCLPALANILGVTTDWLLGNDGAERDEFEATIFVSAILGFTAKCESLQPAEIAIWSNGFLRQVTEVVLQQSGVPIKYVGDGLLAFFSSAEHARRAIVASISAREVVTEPLVVGLAVGRAHLATIGHAEYARPDLLGRTVNCAFRVNAWAATNAESRIAIASEGVLHLEQQFLLKPSSAATLKGIAEPVQISEVLGHNKRE